MKKFIIFSVFVLMLTILFACQSNREQQAQNDQLSLAAHPQVGEVAYQAPKEWVQEQPASRMRKAQFRLPGYDGSDDAVLAVFYFPGTGGTVEANLSRWYRQFKQPDGRLTQDIAQTKKLDVNGLPVTIAYVTGTYLKPQNPMMMGGEIDELPHYAMLAAIAETPNGPWFFKAVGPQKTIDHWRSQFEKFVQTFHIRQHAA